MSLFFTNPPQASVSFIFSQVWVNGGAGWGSTNTAIRRFSSTVSTDGSDITYASSATNGDTFTINSDGMYMMEYTDSISTSNFFGISRNSNQLTTGIESITTNHRLNVSQMPAANETEGITAMMRLVAGDVIRAHTATGLSNGSSTSLAIFRITKVNV